MTISNYISYIYEFSLKTIWCFQNFLTMEFYRKICNKCYWSNVYSSKNSVTKKIIILSVSFIALMFFSFFYLPTDPANSKKSFSFLKISNFLTGFKMVLKSILNCISNKIIIFSSSVINLLKINFYSHDILKMNSALLI